MKISSKHEDIHNSFYCCMHNNVVVFYSILGYIVISNRDNHVLILVTRHDKQCKLLKISE